jgi:hypothetical protein
VDVVVTLVDVAPTTVVGVNIVVLGEVPMVVVVALDEPMV